MELAPCVWFADPAESDGYVAEFHDITRAAEEPGQTWQDVPPEEKARFLRRAYHLARGPRSFYEFPPVDWTGLAWRIAPEPDMLRGLALFAYEIFAEAGRFAELDAINRGVEERALGPDREHYNAQSINVCGELVAGIWRKYRRAPESDEAFAFVGGLP